MTTWRERKSTRLSSLGDTLDILHSGSQEHSPKPMFIPLRSLKNMLTSPARSKSMQEFLKELQSTPKWWKMLRNLSRPMDHLIWSLLIIWKQSIWKTSCCSKSMEWSERGVWWLVITSSTLEHLITWIGSKNLRSMTAFWSTHMWNTQMFLMLSSSHRKLWNNPLSKIKNMHIKYPV